MVGVTNCNAVLGSNPGGPKKFRLGINDFSTKKEETPLTPIQKGSVSSRSEVKSAPESSRPWVNSARCIFRAFSYIYVHVYDLRFGFCIISRTKSKIKY